MSDGIAGPHPDLHRVVCEALQQLVTAAARLPAEKQPPQEHRLSRAPTPEQVTIRCQRTWHDIQTVNPRLNGADFSAVVAQFAQDGDLFSYFVEAVRPTGDETWHSAGMQGGKLPEARKDHSGGFMLVGGSHLCVGGLGTVPGGGRIRVTLADGSVSESTAVDGCCIVLAPVTTPPTPDDHATVQFLGPDGSELAAQRVWMGDGKPPRRR